MPGTITYTPAAGTILAVARQVLFGDVHADRRRGLQAVTTTATINVTKADADRHLGQSPADIPYGTALTARSSTRRPTSPAPSSIHAGCGTILNAGAGQIALRDLHSDDSTTTTQ